MSLREVPAPSQSHTASDNKAGPGMTLEEPNFHLLTGCLSSSGCTKRRTQTEWLINNGMFLFRSRDWEVQDQDAGRSGT